MVLLKFVVIDLVKVIVASNDESEDKRHSIYIIKPQGHNVNIYIHIWHQVPQKYNKKNAILYT